MELERRKLVNLQNENMQVEKRSNEYVTCLSSESTQTKGGLTAFQQSYIIDNHEKLKRGKIKLIKGYNNRRVPDL